MNAAQLERLAEFLLKLRLFKSHERLEALLQDAAAKELAYSDFLEQVLSEEVAAKTSKERGNAHGDGALSLCKAVRLQLPAIDRQEAGPDARVVPFHRAHGDNVLVLGPPGVGKTHLAVALGLRAIESGCCSARLRT